MAGTFPTTGFTVMEFRSNTQTRLTQSLSGKTQRQQIAGQFWSFKLQSPPLTRAEFQPIMAFIMKQGGRFDSFQVVPPLVNDALGTASGTLTSNGSYAAGTGTIQVTGTYSGLLKAGDMIKFSNHNKVYMVEDDVNLNFSPPTSINIFPSLTTAIDNTTTIQYDDVPFTVFLLNDQQQYQVGAPQLFTYEIEVREEL